MRGNQYSDARGPIWHSFWAFAGVTMVCVITVFLMRRLPLSGVGIGAIDLTIAGLWLGPFGLPAFMIVSGVSGIAFALLWRRLGGGREFPFGPSLALGLFLCLMVPALTRVMG